MAWSPSCKLCSLYKPPHYLVLHPLISKGRKQWCLTNKLPLLQVLPPTSAHKTYPNDRHPNHIPLPSSLALVINISTKTQVNLIDPMQKMDQGCATQKKAKNLKCIKLMVSMLVERIFNFWWRWWRVCWWRGFLMPANCKCKPAFPSHTSPRQDPKLKCNEMKCYEVL